MPGEISLKCTECGSITRYQDMVYIDGKLTYNHKLDCSQQFEPHPSLYTHQAVNPSV